MLIDVGGLSFSARISGADDARPVLLLHGFPQSSRCWSRVTPMLTGAGLRTIAPDQRGYSPGARPSEVGAYALPLLVGDALGMMDNLGLATVDVAGHDWGAVVAWHLAARHPDRVRSLVAISVPHPVALSQAMATDPDQQERSAYIRLFRREGWAEQVLLEDDGRRLRRMFAGSGLSETDVNSYVEPLLEPGALTGPLSWYRAASRADADGLGAVATPTTFVWSDGDIAIGRTAAESCERHVSGPYRFVQLTGVSHWVPDSASEAVAAAVLDRVSVDGPST